MKKVDLKSEELISLNEDLHSEFRIQQLESRLETDPLLFMDFFLSELSEGYSATPCSGTLILCSEGGTLNSCSSANALHA